MFTNPTTLPISCSKITYLHCHALWMPYPCIQIRNTAAEIQVACFAIKIRSIAGKWCCAFVNTSPQGTLQQVYIILNTQCLLVSGVRSSLWKLSDKASYNCQISSRQAPMFPHVWLMVCGINTAVYCCAAQKEKWQTGPCLNFPLQARIWQRAFTAQ